MPTSTSRRTALPSYSTRGGYSEGPFRTRARLGWQLITSDDDLERWAVAADLEGIIRSELLSDPTVRVLAVRDEQAVTTGAIINRTGATVGVSNVFTTAATLASAWRDLAAAVGDLFAGVPIVGYEHGNALAAAVESGFEPIAPLRIWLTPAT